MHPTQERGRPAIRKFSTSLAVAIVLGLTQLAGAGPYEDANAAFERGDYEAALRLYRPPAEQGHAEAQYNLGVMYDKGQGVKRDHVESMQWLQRAAEQGNQDAQLYLSDMHEH